jgi:hypothetical protein
VAGRRRLAAVAAAAIALPACSQPTHQQPVPGVCAPLTVLSSEPADGADQIPTDTPVSLIFSDFPDPDTVDLDTVLLSSGVQTRLGSFRVDLLTRSIRFQIRNLLSADLTYMTTVLSDVQSLQGCAAKVDQRTFRTGAGPTDPPPPAAPIPSFTDDVLPIFAARCAGAGCHRDTAPPGGTGGCLAAPAKNLSLCDDQAWQALVDAPAMELAGMSRVAPGDASRSFLMRKIIPGDAGGGPIPTTPGHRDPPDAPLSDTQLRLISDWIDNGGAR